MPNVRVRPLDFKGEGPVRLGMVPANFLKRLALLSGLLPPGIFECWFGIMLVRTVMAATKLEVFESLAAHQAAGAADIGRDHLHDRLWQVLPHRDQLPGARSRIVYHCGAGPAL